MNQSSIYSEIRQSINSGEIAKLPKEKLAEYNAALARKQAYTHFGSSEFPQVCDTVRTLFIASSNEKSQDIKNITPSPASDTSKNIHTWYQKPVGLIGIGVIIFIIGAISVYLIEYHFGVNL